MRCHLQISWYRIDLMSVNGPVSPKQCYYEMDYSFYSFYWLDSLEIWLDHNISRGCCCRNSRPTVINPDYNMTKQRYITRIVDKIRSKSPPNRATSPTCLHCDVMHLSLTTGVVALHIPSWRAGVREEHRLAHKTMWPVNAGRVICRYQNNLCGIINHHKHMSF